MSIVPTQQPRICEFCHKPIKDTTVIFRGKAYHALRDEHGSYVDRPWTCWDKSELGTRSL